MPKPHVVHPAKGSENHLAQRDIRELKLVQGALRQDSENAGTGSVFRGSQQFRKVINGVLQVLHGPSASIRPWVPSALGATHSLGLPYFHLGFAEVLSFILQLLSRD